MNQTRITNTIGGAFLSLLMLGTTSCKEDASKKEVKKPNIIIIMADDLGFGDVSCNGATEIKTPNIDKIATGGIRFTNGYCASSTCTPARYSMLTGAYPWKNKKAEVLAGNAPLLIDTTWNTLPRMLQSQGYKTTVIGKWHLGLGNGNVDWNKEVTPGPRAIGFDSEYIMAATNDRVPCVYINNGHVDNLDPNDPIQVSYKKNFEGEPTGKNNPEMLRMKTTQGHNQSIINGISRIGFMKGGKSAIWKDEDMADLFLEKAKQYVTDHKDKPFFLYYALHEPHVPRLPNSRFVGKSGMGSRGDAILEADWCVGEFMKHLHKLGLDENTIVIFTSDNGPVTDDGYADQADELLGNHKPLGPLRGGKYSLYDGGTRIPFFVKWTNHIKPGESNAVVTQLDFLASFASLLNVKGIDLKDSEDHMDAILGKDLKGRQELVFEALGHKTGLRQGDYIYIPPYKGGHYISWGVMNETGNSKEEQLYNITDDIAQQKNLAETNPAVLKKMKERYQELTKGYKWGH
ncbi:sulfatase-like hydrolase/transferase [Halosquirtibacter laminarini]|uniref:Sulfatase-like hydrolase/transferase n=1 Tax=Halosquirtibacter laminarini TaxID=3374600 RepID=A0AC61NBR3_9BACT|nr:sulfatase-like hydrolase/transferase [Prolixibacteraceae bacterium]